MPYDKLTLYIIRALFFASAVGSGLYIGKALDEPDFIVFWFMVYGAFISFALILAEAFFSRSSIRTVSAIVFGLIIGFLMGHLFTGIITLMGDFREADTTEINILRVILTLVFCYLGVTYILQTKDDFRFIIPYVEFARDYKGPRPLLLDTSAIIDGRIADVCDTGVIDNPIVVPKFVIDELRHIADSKERERKARGRRGLDVLERLRSSKVIQLEIKDVLAPSVPPDAGVDGQLIALASSLAGKIVTNDVNLSKVAKLQGVPIINLNELAGVLKPQVLPGEKMKLKLIRLGEQQDQGVGYLDDGTMVVIEKGRDHIGEDVAVVVTSTIQTNAGRMVFGRLG